MTEAAATKYVPWTAIVSILLTILVLVLGFVLNDTRASICKLQETKLERAEYIKDYEKRNSDIREIKDKLDNLTNAIIDQGIRLNKSKINHRVTWEPEVKK